ncbi:hypothetical protein [Streptomyces sp. NPDC005438]|uniref:hypothetical protein n=1 Tax=Streptomyces sp. NPDC005438 TaxID=3156880 RepID=UPI00339E22F3
MPPLVTVFPPDSDGRRAVRCAGEDLGRAGSLYEVMDLLNGVGLNAAATAFENTDVFEWRGGGPYVWPSAPRPPGTTDPD